MFAVKEKIYIITNNGNRKTGRIIGPPEFKGGEMSYLCEFKGIHVFVAHSKLNKLNFNVVDGGKK